MSLDLSKSSESDLIVANQPVRSTGQSPTTRDEQFNVIEIDSESNSDVIRRTRRTSFNNTNRLSAVSCDSDRKSTISTDSVEILGSTSTTTPESSSVEVITSSSVEVIAVITEPNRYVFLKKKLKLSKISMKLNLKYGRIIYSYFIFVHFIKDNYICIT